MHGFGKSNAEIPIADNKSGDGTPIYGMESNTLSVVDLRRRAGLLNIGEVADLLGLPERKFRYLLESSRLFRPQVKIDRRRRGYYTTEDIAQLREACGQK